MASERKQRGNLLPGTYITDISQFGVQLNEAGAEIYFVNTAEDFSYNTQTAGDELMGNRAIQAVASVSKAGEVDFTIGGRPFDLMGL